MARPDSIHFVKQMKRTRHSLFLLACLGCAVSTTFAASEGDDFFVSKVEPLLRQRCYECHAHEKKIKGGLALDSKAGWEHGGEGGPVLVPGAPEKSRLITAVRYADKDLQMPPENKKLTDAEIAVLEQWVKLGTPDPRQAIAGAKVTQKQQWESLYLARLAWWSLQPVAKPQPPPVKDASWPRNEVDRFILAPLEAKGLKPVAEAGRRTLARRLSFSLTGLPPKPEDVEHFATSTAPHAYEELVQSLLDSSQFGEHWARHWMDVVHYSDTHGGESDFPTKNGWMYRDYLVRAFNADVPFRQLVLEQIAGDLIAPRIDARTGLNESIIGPMALRLGERLGADSAAIEGITQEAMANVIDTLSKTFLATTVGCAQCHDHKFEAVPQRDYYGLAGILMSTRWVVRCADATDPNVTVIAELKRIKGDIRSEMAGLWLAATNSVAEKIAASPAQEPEKPTDSKIKASATSTSATPPLPPGFPDSVLALWRNVTNAPASGDALDITWKKLVDEFQREREKRVAANKTNLRLLADFSRDELPPGWQVDGFGMKHGLVRDGEIIISDEGDAALAQLLPAGRWSHVWSMRLAGAVRSPLFAHEPVATVTVGHAGGKFAAQAPIVDHCYFSERMKFLNQPQPGWFTLTLGDFVRHTGIPDQTSHRVYLELVTKALNNNFPSRSGYGGVKESDASDERSWFGLTRVYQHAVGKAPQDELARFTALFSDASAPTTKEELAVKLAGLVMGAIGRWNQGQCDSEDVRLINDALIAKWLPNEFKANPVLAKLVASYRENEKHLQPDRTVGSLADWNEGGNEKVGVRGSYTDLGDEVERGNLRFLGGVAQRANPQSSGRLEFAGNIASDQNPLTARVFVNRAWHYLFGAGLVRTPDDFGHLGEKPLHPELLDYLTARFIAEGWSTKKLVTLLVTSATWRQSCIPAEAALTADAENRLWHHLPMRRLEGEAIRDSLLAVAGRLDASLYGPPIDPPRAKENPSLRLFNGPLDGNGRRSLYTKMTLMEPPRFLALFNQPIPKLTAGKRDATNVPDQALALLNDPFVIAMAKHWSERVLEGKAASPEQRVQQMFTAAFARPPGAEETARLVKLAHRSAELRGSDFSTLLKCQSVWQDVAHTIFNMKEFIYVQ